MNKERVIEVIDGIIVVVGGISAIIFMVIGLAEGDMGKASFGMLVLIWIKLNGIRKVIERDAS